MDGSCTSFDRTRVFGRVTPPLLLPVDRIFISCLTRKFTMPGAKKRRRVDFHTPDPSNIQTSISVAYDISADKSNRRRVKTGLSTTTAALAPEDEDPVAERTLPPIETQDQPWDTMFWEDDRPTSRVQGEIPGITVITKPKSHRYDTTVSLPLAFLIHFRC